ncbi:MAG: protein kinase, partial [Anaerolineales bacterium]
MMEVDPLIGKQLASFRVDRVAGRGGMATVYYGWDIKLDRPVAIKVIATNYAGDAAYAARFVNEARAIATWHHPNILQVYYADDADGLYYYVMEYVQGQDLGVVLAGYRAEGQHMPQAEVLRIGRAVANALDYAHQRGVIHRDVKPANVMVAEDGRVVLADFGIAMNVAQGTMGTVFGSPHYFSPEQARSSADVVPQSDLYSLGIMLYEMLTGRLPFDDPSPVSLAMQQIQNQPPSPRSINPALSPAVEAVLLKALEKQPANRYQTGRQLMDALGLAFDLAEPTLPFLERPPAPASGPRPPITRERRPPVAARGAAVGGLFTSVAAGLRAAWDRVRANPAWRWVAGGAVVLLAAAILI